MTYTVVSARYADAANSSAIVETVEFGSVAVSAADKPAMWAELHQALTPEPYVPPPPPTPSWSPLEFIERFTEAEQIAIVTAAQSNPALRLFYDKLMASLVVKADEPRLTTGMQALVDAGLITSARRDTILGGA